jgi:2-desacetyl-2-hydroxyethyl bacteriochlorophyllide A dehydrogenase
MQYCYALVRSKNDVVFESAELDHDTPRAGEALLQTEASFISAGTELAIYTGVDPQVTSGWCKYPFHPGYANVSRVLAVGDGVEQVKPGDRVFTFTQHQSHQLFDAFGKGMIARVPDGLDSGLAAAARMAGVAITGIQVADLALHDWVVVLGLGAVGNLAAQFFQLNGARVIGVDPAPARRALAQRMGIERVLGGSEAQVADAVKSLTGGKLARVTVDAVGHSAVLTQAVTLTKRYGQVISLGTPRAPVQGNLTDLLDKLHYGNITFTGALEWRIPLLPANGVRHSSQENVELIYELLAAGKLHVAPLISHRLPAEEIGRAYEGLLNKKDEYFGVVLDWMKPRGDEVTI